MKNQTKEISFDRLYGKLLVIQKADGNTYYCQCLCGQLTKAIGYELIKGHKKSCGCLRKESCGNNFRTHGLSHTPLAQVWDNMKRRCYYEKSADYKNYGGRGITVCEQWKNSFETFANWAIPNGYQKGLEIDRKDNDGNYTPENCHFITQKQSRRNKRNVKLTVEKANEIRQLAGTKPNYMLGKDFGISGSTVGRIIANQAWV